MNAVQMVLATVGLVVPATFAFLVGGEQIAANFLPIEHVTLILAVAAFDLPVGVGEK